MHLRFLQVFLWPDVDCQCFGFQLGLSSFVSSVIVRKLMKGFCFVLLFHKSNIHIKTQGNQNQSIASIHMPPTNYSSSSAQGKYCPDFYADILAKLYSFTITQVFFTCNKIPSLKNIVQCSPPYTESYYIFCVYLILFNIVLVRVLHATMQSSNSFILLVYDVPSHEYNTIHLSIQLLMDIQIVFSFWGVGEGIMLL